MIWTVTLNAVIDHIYLLAGESGDAAELAADSWHVAAGKGMNVSRAIFSLGSTSAAIVLCDDLHAPVYGAALRAVAATAHLVTTRPAIRHHATILYADGRHLHARERGEPCAEGSLEAVARILGDVAAGNDVALSGSLPPGMAPDAYAHLVHTIQGHGGRAWVDCSGDALAAAIAARPFAVKVNAREAAGLRGAEVTGVEQAAAVVRDLLAGGVHLACITLGAAGLVAGDATGTVHACTAARSSGSTVGSGDAALAALVLATARERTLFDAALLAAAAGAANAGGRLPGSFAEAQLTTAMAVSATRWLA